METEWGCFLKKKKRNEGSERGGKGGQAKASKRKESKEVKKWYKLKWRKGKEDTVERWQDYKHRAVKAKRGKKGNGDAIKGTQADWTGGG